MNTVANVKRTPALKKTASAAESAPQDDALSTQIAALNAQVLETLSHLNALIDNRGAWNDGIEGCREAVVLVRGLQGQLHEISGQAVQVESDLDSARAEIKQWNKMHADLASVEKALRTENVRLREENAGLLRVEQELSSEGGKKQALIEKQATSLANLRLLAQEMVREVGATGGLK